MQGWVMRFSIQVWVFMFGYSYSGSEFWSGIEVQVCRFSIQVWVFRVGYTGLGIPNQVFQFRYSGAVFWLGIDI